MDDITTPNQNAPVSPPVTPSAPTPAGPTPVNMPPAKKKGNKGLLITILILLLLLGGGALAYMWWQGKNKKPAQQSTTAQTTTEPKAAIECKDDFTAYENKAEKFAFCYPTAWGEAKTEDPATDENASNVQKGKGIRITFSKENKAKVGLKSVDYEALGHGGACGLFLGFSKVDDFNNIKANTTAGDSSGDGYKSTTKIQKSDDNTFITENFLAGSFVDGPGGECYGVYAYGYQLFSDKTKYVGIGFFWGGSPTSPLALSEFDTYKTNPNSYLSEAERTNFVTTVESAVSI